MVYWALLGIFLCFKTHLPSDKRLDELGHGASDVEEAPLS